MQTSYHDIRHPKASPSYRLFTHPSRRMTFDPCTFRYTSAHHTPLHQRVAMCYIDPSYTFETTCKHLIMTYVTQKHKSHITLHRPSRHMTSDPCTFRYTSVHHMPLHQRVAMRHNDTQNAFAITCQHLITKYVTRNTPITLHFTAPLDE